MKETTLSKINFLKTHSKEICELKISDQEKHKALQKMSSIYSYFIVPEIYQVKKEELEELEELENLKFTEIADIFSMIDSPFEIFENWYKNNLNFYEII